MVNPWHKYKQAPKRKKQTLRSLVAGIAFFAFLYGISKFVSEPLCPIKRLFGVSCFGCGLMRGFISILKLQFSEAVKYHILSIPIFVSICAYSCCCIIDIVFETDLVEKTEKQLLKKYMFIFYFLIMVLSTYINSVR
ncbi:MAG: DUF2752 domain-containing protein [Clostridia bacterium]|nr:DUF2752 domain-containing protein [Clostridia bacterium]